jgi:hypothetical protein
MAQGNPAMKAKRVTGPSAQATMLLHMKLEHCHVKGCEARVLYTKNVTGVKKTRYCADHIGAIKKVANKPFNPASLLKFPWQ